MRTLSISLNDDVARELESEAAQKNITLEELVGQRVDSNHDDNEETRLRKERDLLESIMKTSVSATVVTDTEGQILFANERAEDLLDLEHTGEQPISYHLPTWDITDFDGNPFPDHVFPYRQVVNTGEPVYQVEHAIEREGSDKRLLQINGAPVMDEKGRIARLVFVLEDVTQRQKADEKFERQKDQLTLLNRIVRHDIRNDAHAISGLIYLLRIDYPDTAEQHIAPIETSVQHITNLTENVRDLMKLTFEEREYVPKRVDLNLVLDSEIEKIQNSLKHVTVKTDGLESEQFVSADEMLASLLKNLLFNAVQHNGEEEPVIDVSVKDQDDKVTLEIRDNGPGIPDELKHKILSVEPGSMQSIGGGMGYNLVRMLLADYGGELELDDAPDGGALVRITLKRP